MKRVLIIEKESTTINTISTLLDALNLKPTVMMSWTSSNLSFPTNEVSIVFINIEMPGLPINEIIDKFNPNEPDINNWKVPILFMYSSKNSRVYEVCNKFPHSVEMLKPFKLEDLYYMIECSIDLDSMIITENSLQFKLNQYIGFAKKFNGWFGQLKNLVNV